MSRFATILVLASVLIVAGSAAYAIAIFTQAIGPPWPLAPEPPATRVRSPLLQVGSLPTELPTIAQSQTPEVTAPTRTTMPTPEPTPTLVPTPTPEPTATLVPTPTPVPPSISGLPWIADGIDESERGAARELSELVETNPQAASILLDQPWVADGVNGTEKRVIMRIRDMGVDLSAFVATVARQPWLADDVTQPESDTVEVLWEIADQDSGLAEQLIAIPWLSDGVTQTEADALSDLRYIFRNDPMLAQRLIALPWLVDGLDAVEQSVVNSLYGIAEQDAGLAKAIAGKGWLAEGLSDDAAQAIKGLSQIHTEDMALASRIASMPFLDTLESTDASALEALSWLAYSDPLTLGEVLAHPTLQGGLTDQWAPVVALMDSVNEAAPALLRPLLDPDQVTVERRLASIPHSGTVDLAIIRTVSGAARSMNLLELSVRNVANLMGTGLPTDYIGLFFGTATLGYSGGTNYGEYFVLLPEYDADDGSGAANYAGHLIAHEVAHYYWRDNPNWLDEGLAELLAAISESERAGAAVSIDYTYCSAGDNIALLERLDAAGVIYDYDCNYALGGQFFFDLYKALGDAEFRKGMRDLYLMSQVEDNAGEFDGSPVGIRQIQDAFQAHASEVAPIIDKWYHGTAP